MLKLKPTHSSCFLTSVHFRNVYTQNFLEQARCAEFARAALKTLLDPAATGQKMQYVGLIREEKLPDIRTALESQVYDSWETCANLFNLFPHLPGEGC